MKKALSFILTLVLCLFLCACGGEQNNETQAIQDANNQNTQSSTEKTESRENLINILYAHSGAWLPANGNNVFGFAKDGTTTFDNGTWKLEGYTVTCAWEDGTSDNYEMKNINGTWLLVGDENVMYTEFTNWSNIPQQTIEITEENWQEYFEFAIIKGVTQTTDMWGEVTVKNHIGIAFQLKDMYDRVLRLKNSSVTVRISIDGEKFDCSINEMNLGRFADEQFFGVPFTVDTEEFTLEDFTFEIPKIQGSLCFITGI